MLEQEYEFYLENKKEIIKRHLDKVVVIRHNRIVGIYNSTDEALKESVKYYKIGTFLIHKVLLEEPVAKFTSRVY